MWELCNVKLYKKVNRVPKFGFIEDSSENVQDSDLELEFITPSKKTLVSYPEYDLHTIGSNFKNEFDFSKKNIK